MELPTTDTEYTSASLDFQSASLVETHSFTAMLIGHFKVCLGGQLGAWLKAWLNMWLRGWLRGWLKGWLQGWLGGWLRDWLRSWLRGRLRGWLRGWLGGWLRGWLRPCLELYLKEQYFSRSSISTRIFGLIKTLRFLRHWPKQSLKSVEALTLRRM